MTTMQASDLGLTDRQLSYFNKLLLHGTGKTLDLFGNMFGLDVDSSDSTLEIAPVGSSSNLQHLGDGTLYTVSSKLVGEMRGKALLLMRSDDFRCLGELIKPVLSLLFLSKSDADLEKLEGQKPEWMRDQGAGFIEDEAFHAQMMDTLAEMGNVLIGLYTKALYQICKMNTHHSVPKASKNANRHVIRQFLTTPSRSDRLHLVIENEFVIMDKPIMLWCVISPTRKSFQGLLEKIESQNGFDGVNGAP